MNRCPSPPRLHAPGQRRALHSSVCLAPSAVVSPRGSARRTACAELREAFHHEASSTTRETRDGSISQLRGAVPRSPRAHGGFPAALPRDNGSRRHLMIGGLVITQNSGTRTASGSACGKSSPFRSARGRSYPRSRFPDGTIRKPHRRPGFHAAGRHWTSRGTPSRTRTQSCRLPRAPVSLVVALLLVINGRVVVPCSTAPTPPATQCRIDVQCIGSATIWEGTERYQCEVP